MSEKVTLHRVLHDISHIMSYSYSSHFISAFFHHFFSPTGDSGEKNPCSPQKKTCFWRWVVEGFSNPGDANAVLRSSEHGGACVAA